MHIVYGDLMEITADALINAANTTLSHGGGIALSLVHKGGQVIQDESNKIAYCGIGKVAVTGAGTLRAKYILHIPTVDYEHNRKASYKDIEIGLTAAFDKARNLGCCSVALPLLGTGVVGLDKNRIEEITKSVASKYTDLDIILVIRNKIK